MLWLGVAGLAPIPRAPIRRQRMETRAMILPRLVVASGLALGLPALAVAQRGTGPLDGNWTGRTSQGKAVSFRIEAGVMRTLDLDWTMDLDRVCPGRTGSAPVPSRIEQGTIFYFHPQVRGSEPPPIRFPAFAFSREVEAPDVSVTLALNGSFGSDSTVSGDMSLTATGCPGRGTATWKASRNTARESGAR
jgi:hypothetical protein